MKSPSAQDRFRPMPGLISCAGVTGSGCITYHAYATLLSGLKRCLLKHSSLLVAFYFLQGSPSSCNLQNKLPLLCMQNSNIVRSIVYVHVVRTCSAFMVIVDMFICPDLHTSSTAAVVFVSQNHSQLPGQTGL